MAISEQIKAQFVEFITLQAFDDQYIDCQEEKRILEVGLKNGISVEESLALIQEVALQRGWVLEREADDRAKYLLEKAAANDGKVDKKEFEDAVALFEKVSKGKLPQPEIKKRLKQIMVENGFKAKEGGLFGSKWYSAI
ncbi:hypothetical protein THIOM_003648 [Candidatus Thiomargarita nelsonii]|uniref:Uncharacterized protein n=1 Tax=Candidatus Thiomargarita nelsonii TaxID=1003181 RepID=A0A0A6P179_9GAMM|nr:hypothetical protein THIOM_003648 [Candidatus Thiomargarita nelsonii]